MRMRAFKFRVYPTASQQILIRQSFGSVRFVYNWGIETKRTAYQNGQKLSGFDLIKKLPELKIQHPWLSDTNSQSLQATLRNLDSAFIRFFKKLARYPQFKSRHHSNSSFLVPQHFSVDQKNNTIVVPKIGSIKAVLHRTIEGEPRSITLSMSKSGKFFASILVQTDEEDRPVKPVKPATAIGVDLGLKSFLVDSNGKKVENPRHLRKSIQKLKYLSKQFSRKQKDGKNRERARLCLARQYEKVSNQRADFLHKLTTRLVRENQAGTICVEDLNIAGMMRNHKLARSIQDASWGEWLRMLEYKCKWHGVNLVRIGRFEPSSRLCPCGYRNKELTLRDREWTCPKCGATHDRDILAAQNIRAFGIIKTCGGTRRVKIGELPVCNPGAMNQESMPFHRAWNLTPA